MTTLIVKMVTVVVAAFLLGASIAFAWTVVRPAPPSKEVFTLTVKPGEGPRTITKYLQDQGIPQRPFLLYVLLTGKRNSFYPGTYQFSPRSSIHNIVSQLTDQNARRIALTIIEGWRIKDIAAELPKKTSIKAADFEEVAPVETYEGYLFPDTYYLVPETTARELIKMMRDNFTRRTKGLSLTKDNIILASIVEREAKHEDDRAKIAGVYQNRLKADLPLQADPTVQYAKGNWEPVMSADYRSVASPYNTYLNKGLPPTPIANPGLASLKAAIQPERHDYFYFFHTPTGQTVYSKTLQEHNDNKAKHLK